MTSAKGAEKGGLMRRNNLRFYYCDAKTPDLVLKKHL